MNVSYPLSFKAKTLLYPVSILHGVDRVSVCTVKRSSPVPTGNSCQAFPLVAKAEAVGMIQWVNVPDLPS